MAGIKSNFKERYYDEVSLRAELSAMTIHMRNWGNKLNPVFSKLETLNTYRAERYEVYSEFLDTYPKFSEYVQATFALVRSNLYINKEMIKEAKRLKKEFGLKTKFQWIA